VQQVALPYYEQAIEAGEPASKHSLVPYGINISCDRLAGSFPDIDACRARLGLSCGRKVVISVGYISARHKRMDYVVKEVSRLAPEERPFLLLVGQQDSSTAEIVSLAEQLLGSNGYRVASVPYAEMGDYYGASDAFVLASLKEGFGRVLLEASSFGLPCAADDNPVMRYVLAEEGSYCDMRQAGALASLLPTLIANTDEAGARLGRVEAVQRRFGWDSLQSDYLEMFRNTSVNASTSK
jgi:glycosyltransferase involved in cell wall biosynthesis